MLHGYARVSTGEQTLDAQIRELRAAGCISIAEEHASGGDPGRPVLSRLLRQLDAGDTLVVVRLDRLGRSLQNLLETINDLHERGIHFRSLGDPVDTASPQGRFTLQILGAMAEFERALIRERTLSGLAAARAEGRKGGNPGLVSGDEATLRRLRLARRDAFLERLSRNSEEWVPDVRRLRPETPWQDVLSVINSRLSESRHWTLQRLVRAARIYVTEGLLPATVMERATERRKDDRLPALVAAMRKARPDVTLQEMCDMLEAMHEPTPRGRMSWHPSSVRSLLKQADRLGIPASDAKEDWTASGK
ncbi:MAG: recombinase family protein [Boseongicola sp. SB0677_bin_26]|nr:recombinase family protein [Boseongicola sp. SB0665_bin_10]MYG25490.1 recombinase family protein [Boseongicola sp. SB0677_bin_26]